MILWRSLDDNNLTKYGKDMSAVLKLAEVLPQTKIHTLRCLLAKCRRSMLTPFNFPVPALESDQCQLASLTLLAVFRATSCIRMVARRSPKA